MMSSLKNNDTSSTMLLDGDLNGKYVFNTKNLIGRGQYGQIFKGRNMYTFDEVAVKIVRIGKPGLHNEDECYTLLGAKKFYHNIPGLPEVYFFGPIGVKYFAIAMELLGPSLKDLLIRRGRKFSLKTVLSIAVQVLPRIEYVHGCKLIHGDIKPENVTIGRPSQHFPYNESTENTLYLIDFGLARPYVDPETEEHIPYKTQVDIRGTIQFLSVNAHSHIEQSRRDDLESLGYMLVYLVNGTLPWTQISENNSSTESNETKTKKEISSKMLCDGLPEEFVKYFEYVKQLNFTEKPNYEMLKTLFYSAYERNKSPDDKLFDWF